MLIITVQIIISRTQSKSVTQKTLSGILELKILYRIINIFSYGDKSKYNFWKM